MKTTLLFMLILLSGSLSSCWIKKDYHCSLDVVQISSDSSGTQYFHSRVTKDCHDCTKKQIDELKNDGYSCNK